MKYLYDKRCERWAPKNEKLRQEIRDCYLGFDGRLSGPANKPEPDLRLRKDRGDLIQMERLFLGFW